MYESIAPEIIEEGVKKLREEQRKKGVVHMKEQKKEQETFKEDLSDITPF